MPESGHSSVGKLTGRLLLEALAAPEHGPADHLEADRDELAHAVPSGRCGAVRTTGESPWLRTTGPGASPRGRSESSPDAGLRPVQRFPRRGSGLRALLVRRHDVVVGLLLGGDSGQDEARGRAAQLPLSRSTLQERCTARSGLGVREQPTARAAPRRGGHPCGAPAAA